MRIGIVCMVSLLVAGCAAMDGGSDGGDATMDAATEASCGPCPVWSVRCGTHCVDPTVSTDNCGACGVTCDTRTEVCQGGVCMHAARCTAVGDGGGTIAPDATGLRGEYFANIDVTALSFVRVDHTVDFNWMTSPPNATLGMTNFSAQWTGQLHVPMSSTFTLYTVADDGVRLWIDDRLVIDDWQAHAPTENSAVLSLEGGAHAIQLQYFQGTGGGEVHLSWSAPGLTRQVIPATALTPETGAAFTSTSGACCDTGGSAPISCPAGTRCVHNTAFQGCCPDGEACGRPETCEPAHDAGAPSP